MAGVQPQSPTGGRFSAAMVWLIIFVVLWVGFTVSTVLLALKHEEMSANAEKAKAAETKQRQATSAARAEYSQLAKMVTGGDDDLETVRTKITASLSRVVEDAQVPDTTAVDPGKDVDVVLLDVADQMYTWFMGEKRRADQADAQASDLARQRDDAVQARDSQKQSFDTQVARLSGELKDAEVQGQTFEQKVQNLEQTYLEARATLERTYDDERRKLTEDVQSLTDKTGSLEDLVERQGDIIAGSRAKVEQWGVSTQADGRVLSAVPGADVVYIDLGRTGVANPITLGLTFEVFSPHVAVVESGAGKARIEVVGIYDDTSACKIVQSTPGQPVLEGDLVINPIYDRTQKYRFVVLGDFDLNGDGRDDVDAAATVASMVAEWGGQVVASLDARTDFVILGTRPTANGKLSEAATAAEVDAYARLEARGVRYDKVLDEAKALRVTILRQNQFLSFVNRSKG